MANEYANLADLQRLLGLNRDKIKRHIDRADLDPLPGTKEYNVKEVCQAIIDNRKEDPNNSNAAVQEQRVRLLKSKADLEEIKVHVRKKQVIEIEIVIDELEKFLSVIQQTIRAVPSKLATRIGRKESQLVKKELDAILNELSEYNPVTGKSGARLPKKRTTKSRAKAKTAAESNGDRVGKPKKKAIKRR